MMRQLSLSIIFTFCRSQKMSFGNSTSFTTSTTGEDDFMNEDVIAADHLESHDDVPMIVIEVLMAFCVVIGSFLNVTLVAVYIRRRGFRAQTSNR